MPCSKTKHDYCYLHTRRLTKRRSDPDASDPFSPEASVPPAFIGTVVDLVERAGGQVLFVSLTCSEAVIEGRIEAASRSAFRKLTSLSEYRHLRAIAAFAFPPLPADITIATDDVSPEDAAGLIQELIGNRGLH